MARVVNVLLGLDEVPGATITRDRPSSVQTTRMAFHAIKAGEGHAFISAGVETVSRFAKGTSDHWPDTHNHLYDDAKARTDEQAQGGQVWHDPRQDDKIPDVYIAMGQTAENVATLRGLDRKELADEFGVRSQNLAEKAIADGFWEREITPVTNRWTAPWSPRTTARVPASPTRLFPQPPARLPSRWCRHRRNLPRALRTAPRR